VATGIETTTSGLLDQRRRRWDNQAPYGYGTLTLGAQVAEVVETGEHILWPEELSQRILLLKTSKVGNKLAEHVWQVSHSFLKEKIKKLPGNHIQHNQDIMGVLLKKNYTHFLKVLNVTILFVQK